MRNSIAKTRKSENAKNAEKQFLYPYSLLVFFAFSLFRVFAMEFRIYSFVISPSSAGLIVHACFFASSISAGAWKFHSKERATGAATAKPMQQPADSGRGADQHNDGDDTPNAPIRFAALRPVEFAVEKRDYVARQHDRMWDDREHRRHVAKHRIERQPDQQQEQRVVQRGAGHRKPNVGFRGTAINRSGRTG